ncbi:MAG: carboxypeptidase-like regulatory domain-containing protein [Bacteroidetes bacterium]|nr:carboxypeptidase-like regulatory domain-containing protein [Bacteroidota bacterium]
MKHLFTLFLVFLVNLQLLAQLVKGKVIDAGSKKEIPYVNIGVVGKGIGTVSDANGDFVIYLHDSINNGTLKLSCIGYKTKEFNVLRFKSSGTSIVELEENIVSLSQVVVKPKKIKTKILGNENKSKSMVAGFHTNDLGSELGVIMHIKKKPTYIEKASFNVAYNDAGVVKFRVNIYNMKNGLVDSIILKQPIIVEIDKLTRVLTVDLKNYNLVVENDFLVSLEWIEGYGSDKISFCAGLMNGNCLYRKTSQDAWHKANPVGVGFNCTVTYEK